MKKTILLSVLVFVLTGCSQNLFNFTLVSTKSIDLAQFSTLQKSSKKVTGEDKASLIIIIPTRTIKIDQAITNTIDAIPGCVALLDGTVYSKFWYIPYIYGEQKFVIEATPLIDPSFSEFSGKLPRYGRVLIDKKGNVDAIEAITEASFLAEKEKIAQNSTKETMGYLQ